MFREDLAWEMISRMIHGDDSGLTPLEKEVYDEQRASYLKDVAEGHHYEYYVPSDMTDHGIEFSYIDKQRGFNSKDMRAWIALLSSLQNNGFVCRSVFIRSRLLFRPRRKCLLILAMSKTQENTGTVLPS